MTKPTATIIWYNQRKWAAIIGPLALLAAYGAASRALDTGSLQQWALSIALLLLGLNRLAHIVITSFLKRTA